MMEEILVCENLTMTFNDGEYIVHALKNVSFSLEKAFPLSEGKFAVVTAQSRTDGKYLATVIDCTPLSQ
jgi:ABC-type dipeptide/oligopeptide/nickel transport system ATPase subunit